MRLPEALQARAHAADGRLYEAWSRSVYAGLEAVVLKRLVQYRGLSGLAEERRAAARMFDLLGRRMGPKLRKMAHLPERLAKPFLAFPEEVERLTHSPKVLGAMVRIARQMDAARAANQPYDLWGAMEQAAGSPRAALEWMAVLFQDAPHAGEYFETLEPPEMKAALTRILETVEAPRGTWALKAFPPGVQSDDPRLYHYYVPAYLTARLVESGIRPQAASSVTFLLESEYQSFKARSSQEKPMRAALQMLGKGARQGDFFERPWLTDGIYLGYAGSRAGAGTPVPRMTPAVFEARAGVQPRALFAEVVQEGNRA